MAQPAQAAEPWGRTRARALGARARSGACPWQEHRQGCRSAAKGPWPGRMTWAQARQRTWARGSEQPVWAQRVQAPTGSVPLPAPLLAASRWRSRMQGAPRTRVAGPQIPQPVQMENAPHVEEPARHPHPGHSRRYDDRRPRRPSAGPPTAWDSSKATAGCPLKR